VRRSAIELNSASNNQSAGAHLLVIPPLGTRVLPEHVLNAYAWQDWESCDLISVTSEDTQRAASYPPVQRKRLIIPLAVFTIGAIGGWFVPALFFSIWFWVMLILVTMVALVTAQDMWSWLGSSVWSPVQRYLAESLGWIGVAVFGIALPCLFIGVAIQELGISSLASQNGSQTSLNNLTLVALGVLLLFIAISSTLPAGLYFLFKRQKIWFLRRKFLLEIMRLCPIVQTRDDVEELYGPTLDDIYGCNKSGQSPLSTYIPVWISTILFSLGWSITLLPTLNTIQAMNSHTELLTMQQVIASHSTALVFGFLGSYFFAINFIFRRYVRADLGPKAYSHLAMRMIVTIILVWVVSRLPFFLQDTSGSNNQSVPQDPVILLIFSFMVGIVPETATAVIQDFLHSQRWIGNIIPSLWESLPLTRLEGITLYDRARLLEEGIDNIENLAHHNLVELMLQTRIPTPRLVDLVDQSILHLHVQESKQPADQVTKGMSLQHLQEYGIRTATDLEAAYKKAKGSHREDAFVQLLDDSQTGMTGRLPIILDALVDDEWMPQLRHWHDTSYLRQQPYTLNEFVTAHQLKAP